MSAVTVSTANGIEDKALELLGMGFEQVHVANALSVTESRISQLLADETFSKRLAELKYKQLAKHNETDNTYDRIEKKLADKLEQAIPMMFKPQEIANTLAKVNSLKRRGASSPEALTRVRPTVKLQIPIAVVNRFQMNAAGQVVSAGVQSGETQDLVTIQSGNMKALVDEHSITHDSEAERFANGKHVLPKRLRQEQLTEADGVRFQKAQGREFHDVLDECGFTVEVITEAPSPSKQ